MKWTFLLIFLAVGCEFEGGEGAEGDDEGGTTDTTTDTTGGISGTCNTANESCGPGTCGGEGASMLPGADCLSCHKAGGGEAPRWTAGGTVFTDADGGDGASGVKVHITDSNGDTTTLTSNGVGNFYTAKTLVPPLTVELETANGTVAMGRDVSTGACNTCHTCDGEAGGKLYEP